VHRVASDSGERVNLFDAEQQFAASPLSENGLPGQRLFHEHVHFNFDGDHQMAAALLPSVAHALSLGSVSKSILSRNDCARALAYTVIDEVNIRSAITRLTSFPPFLDQLDQRQRQLRAENALQQLLRTSTEEDVQKALATYRAAIEARPDDWMLRFNYASVLAQLKKHADAVPYFAQVVERVPLHQKYRIALANSLIEAGKASEARQHFEAALKLDPGFQPARDGLRLAKAKLR
jgi:tetratricopeptide (TPR) repeat protein